MRILVTGVSGQVGNALRKPLQSIGTVIAADRSILDLSRPGALAETLSGLAPDIIINPAAYTAVDQAEDEPELAYRVNAEAPGRIAAWAARRGIPLIHFSTDYVFDGSNEHPWREDSPTHPLSIYGSSKLAGETAIVAAAGPHLIVRTSWVYASRGKNFLTTIVRLARERKELTIVDDQIGAPTSATVIANVVTTIIKGNLPDLPKCFERANGIVNVACSGETTWYGFGVSIVDGMRLRRMKFEVESINRTRTENYPTKAKRPKNSRLDMTRLNQVFEIETSYWLVSLSDELDELAADLTV